MNAFVREQGATSGAVAGVRVDIIDTRRVVKAREASTFVDVDPAVHTGPTYA
jgi:hypothetical protein